MQLRGYLPSDLDAMVSLDDICFDPPFRFTRVAMQGFAEAKRAHVVVAESDGELAGFAILHLVRGDGYVVTLDVAPEKRRIGLATLLMAELEREARRYGCLGLALHVYAGNGSAVRFYERLGFAFQTTVWGFYGEGLDALAYRLPFVGA
jgi:ribosomal-protein-alanine N-acetyltransferase